MIVRQRAESRSRFARNFPPTAPRTAARDELWPLFGHGELQEARIDVYALGAILCEILTLRRLHPGDSHPALADSTRNIIAACSVALRPDVPPELDAACARAAARDRAKRWPNASRRSARWNRPRTAAASQAMSPV